MLPVTIKLRQPIEFGKETIDEIVLRPPVGKDFRDLPMRDGYLLDTLLVMAERLSGRPSSVIDRLGGDDLMEVLDVAGGFMPGGATTGRSGSPSSASD